LVAGKSASRWILKRGGKRRPGKSGVNHEKLPGGPTPVKKKKKRDTTKGD